MSRVLTTYKRPSIGDLIRSAPGVNELAKLRWQIGERHEEGKITADERTIRDWREAIFFRLCQLIDLAPDAASATYVYNSAFRWYTDDTIRGALSTLVRRRCQAL